MLRHLRSLTAALVAALVAGAGPVAAAGPAAPARTFVLGHPHQPEAPEGPASALLRSMQGELSTSEARVRLVDDNAKAWQVRWWALSQAKESIDVTYFIVDDDPFGRSLMGLIALKAQQGVRVRFMVDRRGSKHITGMFHTGMIRALAGLENVEVRVFNPWHKSLWNLPRDVRSVIASNHDKIIIVDDEVVVTGGRNIGWHYFADPETHPDARRDTDVLIEGEAVARQARRAFEEEFQSLVAVKVRPRHFGLGQRHLDDLEKARRAMNSLMIQGKVPPLSRDDDGWNFEVKELAPFASVAEGYSFLAYDPWQGRRRFPVTILDKHSRKGDRNDVTRNLVSLVDAAQVSVVLQNPYVVLTRDVMMALIRAGERGVKVILHTNSPTSTNQIITQAFFLRDWKKMLRDVPTLRIFAYTGERVLHAKNVIIDDRIAAVGTYNLDPMSESINSEMVAVMDAPSVARRLRLRIEEDLRDSVEYKVRIDEHGLLHKVVGPEDHVEEKSRFWIQFFQTFKFLRPLI